MICARLNERVIKATDHFPARIYVLAAKLVAGQDDTVHLKVVIANSPDQAEDFVKDQLLSMLPIHERMALESDSPEVANILDVYSIGEVFDA